MIQAERETAKAAQARKAVLPCTLETSKASPPKEQGQLWLQMKPEREISQRGVPASNTSKVSPQTRIKTIKITTQKENVHEGKGTTARSTNKTL